MRHGEGAYWGKVSLFVGFGIRRHRDKGERNANGYRTDDSEKRGPWKVFLNIVKTTMHLPKRIRAVCWITFWSWIGHYPLPSIPLPFFHKT